MEELLGALGFAPRGLYIGERARSGGSRGGGTIWRRGWGGPRAAVWSGPSGAQLRLPFGLHVGSGKIGTLQFESSDSEKVSRSTFLKPKTAENRELTLWHLVNRLVPENA